MAMLFSTIVGIAYATKLRTAIRKQHGIKGKPSLHHSRSWKTMVREIVSVAVLMCVKRNGFLRKQMLLSPA